MGMRFKRFSMIVDDGVVRSLNIEETPGTAEASRAKKIPEILNRRCFGIDCAGLPRRFLYSP